MEKMAALGVVDGVGGGNFAPGVEYTREQSIVTMLRMLSYLQS